VLCASFVVQEGIVQFCSTQDEFVRRYENVKRKRRQEEDMRMKEHLERTPQDKRVVKTEILKGKQFKLILFLTERVLNNVKTKGNKKNGAKRKPCQENVMWREENVKRRRCQ
jgi:hypothetical protein